jgi:diguanylate cyclase (GGDEF)-like protein
LRRRYGLLLLPACVLLIGVALSVFVGQLDLQHRHTEERADVRLRLSLLSAQAQTQVRNTFSQTEGITQLLSVDGSISAEHFHGIVDQAKAAVPALRHVVLAPNDVIADVWPLLGNEVLVGKDYRSLPDQYPLIHLARSLGIPILAGPIDLVQGGRGLVYRRPVFRLPSGIATQYWGMVSVVVDVDALIRSTAVNAEGPLLLALRDRLGKPVWGEQQAFADDPVLTGIEIPGGRWELAGMPRAGWSAFNLLDSSVFALSLLASAVFSAFALQMGRSHALVARRNDELNSEVHERTLAEQRLEQLAHFDAVTGLANRVLFRQRLVDALDEVSYRGRSLGVMILDIDGFKIINDTLGHATGDLLLRQATRRFLDNVAAGDSVARLGGDEFGFILHDLERPEDAVHMVRDLLRSLTLPFDLNGNMAQVTASIGVAISPLDGDSAEDLLRHADTAMYSAKEAGRNDFRFYQAAMTEQIQRRVDMEHALRRALANGEFEVWYQPKLDLASGRLEGAEALLRWRDPQHGLVMPADFIPLAERTGLIIAIGEWVLDQACQHIRQWRAQGCFTAKVAINVAAPQIERGDFVATVRQALQRHGLPGEALEVEVTESLLLESHEAASGVLRQLQAMGVTTAIDDFGTGYSSLAYLKRLPIDHLKVDRAFIRDLPGDQDFVAIVQAIIALKRAMNFRMTAEGIETKAQYDFLRDAGCDAGQGYYISEPVPAPEFAAWLRRNSVCLMV